MQYPSELGREDPNWCGQAEQPGWCAEAAGEGCILVICGTQLHSSTAFSRLSLSRLLLFLCCILSLSVCPMSLCICFAWQKIYLISPFHFVHIIGPALSWISQINDPRVTLIVFFSSSHATRTFSLFHTWIVRHWRRPLWFSSMWSSEHVSISLSLTHIQCHTLSKKKVVVAANLHISIGVKVQWMGGFKSLWANLIYNVVITSHISLLGHLDLQELETECLFYVRESPFYNLLLGPSKACPIRDRKKS